MTDATIHIDTVLNLPLEDGSHLPVRQGIEAHPTNTDGLATFPALTGPFQINDNEWHVTHVHTGRRIPVTFTSQATATAFANAIGHIADWAAPKLRIPAAEVIHVVTELVHIARQHGGIPDKGITDALARRAASD